MFSCQFCERFKDTFLHRTTLVAVSEISKFEALHLMKLKQLEGWGTSPSCFKKKEGVVKKANG